MEGDHVAEAACHDRPAGLTEWVEDLRLKIVPPFKKSGPANGATKQPAERHTSGRGNARILAGAEGDEILDKWSAEETDPRPIHLTVWEQMHTWLDNVNWRSPQKPFPCASGCPYSKPGWRD